MPRRARVWRCVGPAARTTGDDEEEGGRRTRRGQPGTAGDAAAPQGGSVREPGAGRLQDGRTDAWPGGVRPGGEGGPSAAKNREGGHVGVGPGGRRGHSIKNLPRGAVRRGRGTRVAGTQPPFPTTCKGHLSGKLTDGKTERGVREPSLGAGPSPTAPAPHGVTDGPVKRTPRGSRKLTLAPMGGPRWDPTLCPADGLSVSTLLRLFHDTPPPPKGRFRRLVAFALDVRTHGARKDGGNGPENGPQSAAPAP